MNIIFAGGELASFYRFNAEEEVSIGAFSAPARCAIHVKKGGHIRTETLGNRSEMWLHFDVFAGQIRSGLTPLNITTSIGASVFSIGSDGRVYIGTTTVGTIPMAVGLFTYDIYLRGGAFGALEIYVNKQLQLSVSGSLAINDMHTLRLSPFFDQTSGTSTSTFYSQIIASTESTVGHRLATLNIESIGTHNEWLASTNSAADVGEITLNDATYISAPNLGMVTTWNIADLPAQFSNDAVLALVVSALGKVSATGPKNLEAAMLVGGGLHYRNMAAIGMGYTPSQVIVAVNPVTNAAWTASELNALEIGLRSKG